MKKLLLAIFGFAFAFVSITHAQGFDLGYVDLNFCDGQNQLHVQASWGTQTWFCFTLTNLSNSAGSIKIGLVDWEMSVWEHSVKACKTTSDGYFTKFVTLSWDMADVGKSESWNIQTKSDSDIIALPPLGSVTQYWFINIPSWFVGMLNGCITLTVSEGNANDEGMFQIVNRKANTIDIEVTGDYVSSLWLIDMKNYSWDKWKLNASNIVSSPAKILVTHNKDVDSLVIGMGNTGFVNEQFQISATIKTWFGKFIQNNIVLASGVLYWQDSMVIEYPIKDLPFYKGKYLVEIKVQHNLVGAEWTDLNSTDSSLQKQDFTFFLFPARRVMGIYALLIILLVGSSLLIAKKIKKKKLVIKKTSPEEEAFRKQ